MLVGLRLGGPLWIVGACAELKNILHHILHLGGEQVICITDAAAIYLEAVSRFRIAVGSSQEKLVVDLWNVAVGHIYQIVILLQPDYVPHVIRTAAIDQGSGQGSYCSIAGCVIKSAQVAEILESLGITLAYHICFFVAVKHIYYLPGVAVIVWRCHSITVVVGEGADFLFVFQELLVVAETLTAIYDLISGINRLLRCEPLLGVYFVAIVGTACACGIAPGNLSLGIWIFVAFPYLENQLQSINRYGPRFSINRQFYMAFDAVISGFAQPVQLIGHVDYQTINNGVYIQDTKELFRKDAVLRIVQLIGNAPAQRGS